MIGALDLGLIFGLMALGVYLTFRVLDFADLTIDGSFVTGAATTSIMLTAGIHFIPATLAGFAVGLVAGFITGLLNTVGKIHPLLAGILTQIGLYSVNLRIMGGSNINVSRSENVFSGIRDAGLLGTWASVAALAVTLLAVLAAFNWFMTTDIGLSLRATGDNEGMARSYGINTDLMKIIGLSLSNGLVGLSGSLFAQYQGYADIGMGIGLIVAGLASVIIGTAIFNSGRIWITTAAVVAGSILYRLIIQTALYIPWFDPNDMKLLSATIVVIALLLPRWDVFAKFKKPRHRGGGAEAFASPSVDPEAADAGDMRPVVQGYVKKAKHA